MHLNKEEIQFLLKSIRKHFPSPEFEILLFGSYAKGTANERSDVDIVLRGKKKLPSVAWQILEDELAESEFKKRVDIVDYNRVSADFQRHIDSIAIPLESK